MAVILLLSASLLLSLFSQSPDPLESVALSKEVVGAVVGAAVWVVLEIGAMTVHVYVDRGDGCGMGKCVCVCVCVFMCVCVRVCVHVCV